MQVDSKYLPVFPVVHQLHLELQTRAVHPRGRRDDDVTRLAELLRHAHRLDGATHRDVMTEIFISEEDDHNLAS